MTVRSVIAKNPGLSRHKRVIHGYNDQRHRHWQFLLGILDCCSKSEKLTFTRRRLCVVFCSTEFFFFQELHCCLISHLAVNLRKACDPQSKVDEECHKNELDTNQRRRTNKFKT